MKPTKSISNIARLLPNYFKKIGIGIIIATLGAAFAIKYLVPNPDAETKLLLKTLFFSLLNISLFMISMSKDKLEDERSMLMRMQAMLFTILFAVIYLFIKPIIDIAFGEPISELSANGLMLLILIEYIVFYRVQKKTQS